MSGRLRRLAPLALLALPAVPAAPAWAHHAGAGDDGLGLAWWLFGAIVLVLAGMAGWAFFTPGADEPADEDDPGRRTR